MTTKLLRTLMGMVALVAMLTACSSEDVLLDEPNAKNEITFNVTTNRASRALNIFNSGNLPTYFRFSAWKTTSSNATGEQYVLKDLVVNKGTTDTPVWQNVGGLRYWPGHNETLDFYAWCCGAKEHSGTPADSYEHSDFSWYDDDDETYRPKLDVNIKTNVAEQQDLVYAVQFNQSMSTADKTIPAHQQVDLQFHHAFCQVAFTAQNKSNKIHIEIKEFGMGNVSTRANYYFPTRPNGTTGDWGSFQEYQSIGFNGLANAITVNETKTPITGDNTDRILMLIPQKVTNTVADNSVVAWNVESSTKPYIWIKCKVWNIANAWEGYDEGNETLIFGSTGDNGYEEIRIPIDLDWTQGNRYIYNLIFGTGNAGYDTNGRPAIVPMTYSVNVDNWAEQTDKGDVTESGNPVKDDSGNTIP